MSFEKNTDSIIDDLLDHLNAKIGGADIVDLDKYELDETTGFLINPDEADEFICPGCESIIFEGESECSVCGRPAGGGYGEPSEEE